MTQDLARTRLGMLTPSSNTVLEPVTAAMLSDLPDVSAHFARFRVVRISLEADALDQFGPAPMLEAAELLADAQVQTICWNGTSSGWLGFDSDRRLIEAIEARTGVTACSAVLALNEVLDRMQARRIALLTPYLPEIQARIIETYRAHGIEIVAERHLSDPGNFSFATYSQDQILGLARELIAEKPEAIVVFCTNFRGAGMAETIEAETGIPVLDSVAAALWASMRSAGEDPRRIRGWGRLFDV